MLIKYQIRNNFERVSGSTQVGLSKTISIPINMEFLPVDYGEDVQDIVLAERQKAINPIFDAETTRYTYSNNLANSGKGLMIQFRFWDLTASTYNISYNSADITDLDIIKNKNVFKKSFFRLYFYDSNSGDTSNLIFTEDLNVNGTAQPILQLNRLYWLRNDEYFIKNNNNRIVYMTASFFNAKTGKVQRFINLPMSPPSIPITIDEYKNPINRDWRTSAIEIINPKLNNGGFNFKPNVPFGANGIDVITMSEFIMV